MTPTKTSNTSVKCNAFAMWSQEFLLSFNLTIIINLEKVIFKDFAKIIQKKTEASDPFRKELEF